MPDVLGFTVQVVYLLLQLQLKALEVILLPVDTVVAIYDCKEATLCRVSHTGSRLGWHQGRPRRLGRKYDAFIRV